jgi:hypothetical protein
MRKKIFVIALLFIMRSSVYCQNTNSLIYQTIWSDYKLEYIDSLYYDTLINKIDASESLPVDFIDSLICQNSTNAFLESLSKVNYFPCFRTYLNDSLSLFVTARIHQSDTSFIISIHDKSYTLLNSFKIIEFSADSVMSSIKLKKDSILYYVYFASSFMRIELNKKYHPKYKESFCYVFNFHDNKLNFNKIIRYLGEGVINRHQFYFFNQPEINIYYPD